MVKTISSQRFIDDSIVADKIASDDFDVIVSPVFTLEDGTEVRVILDGHHSYHAAIEAGEQPEFIEASTRDHDAVGLILDGRIDEFLEVTHMGSDYYDVATGFDL